MSMTQKQRAVELLRLHHDRDLLVLINVWNPIGARMLEAEGHKAVATASAAISASLGYEDGQMIRRSTLLAILKRIATSVNVPVTADIEGGYASSLDELEETTHKVLNAGVAGINIEDSTIEGAPLRSIEEQCKRIERVRFVADKRDVPLVINARTDSFVTDTNTTNSERIADAVRRAAAYREAGADCIYPIGPGDVSTVRELREQIEGPINILATPTAAPLKTMQELGVDRVSLGPFAFRALLGKFLRIASEMKSLGSYECFADMMLPRDAVRRYLIHDPEPED